MLYIGFKDHSYYVGVNTSKAMYVLEYLEDINSIKMETWSESVKLLQNHKDIHFSCEIMDQESFASKYMPIMKSYGLGTSFGYVDKLIMQAIRNITK